jgi:3D (Asp-Asp-Asp) domain-containing protein
MNLKHQRFALIILFVSSMAMHLVYGIEGAAQMDALESKVIILELNQSYLEHQNAELEVENDILGRQLKQCELDKQYAGEFEITYYTAGPESTGKNPGDEAYGITRSGTTVKEGQTIAADWTVLPEGTKVYIEGVGERIVEDTGGDIIGQAIDVYVEDVNVALENGRHMAKVWVIEGETNEIY